MIKNMNSTKRFITITFFSSLLFVLLWNCENNSDIASVAPSDTGVAGSYARFMLVGDFMYVVGSTNIKTFQLENPADPILIDEQYIGTNIETVFNLRDRLFIGSGDGLYIYTISEEGKPVKASETTYDFLPFTTCDPVVANDTFAYVTLNSTQRIGRCRRIAEINLNLLNIFDVTDINNPQLMAQYEMHNPKGVGLDGNILFLCDDTQGLKIFDVSDPNLVKSIAHFDDFIAFDVIPLGGLLLVVGPDNVYQFDYTDLNNIHKISEIPYGI